MISRTRFYLLLLFLVYNVIIVFAQSSPMGSRAIKHIFEGDVKVKNGRIQANGCHHMQAVKDKKARLVEGSLLKGPNGVTKAKVQIYDFKTLRWVSKVSNSGYSTIFPEDWSKEKTIKEILFAYQHRKKVPGGYNEYWARSEDGKIEIRMYINEQEEIISAFPKDWTR